MQDTGKYRLKTIDKFYTRPAEALHCISLIKSTIPFTDDLQWIEPAAGSGAFLHGVDDVIALDLEPASDRVTSADFLTWSPPLPSGRLLFYGNPPFGRQGSLAKAFIQRACSFEGTEVIAFILPRSFQKPSMSRAFPLRFHCLVSEELDPCSFEVNGSPYAVPCVFQIWIRRAVDRVLAEPEEPAGFAYVKQEAAHHLVIRRVGVNAGTSSVAVNGQPKSAQSHYFVCLDPAFVAHAEAVASALTAHAFPSNTTGPRSLSKGEVTAVLNGILGELTGA
jgi:hypothetical protein